MDLFSHSSIQQTLLTMKMMEVMMMMMKMMLSRRQGRGRRQHQEKARRTRSIISITRRRCPRDSSSGTSSRRLIQLLRLQTLLLLVTTILLLLVVVHAPQGVHGQRAIVNFGKKLLGQHGHRSSRKTDSNDFIFQGENNQKNQQQQQQQQPPITSLVAKLVPVVVMGILLLLLLLVMLSTTNMRAHIATTCTRFWKRLRTWLWSNDTVPIMASSSSSTTTTTILKEDLVIQDDKVVAMGGMESLDIAFDGIKLALKTGKNGKNGNQNKKEEERLLLDGSIRGRARPGRLLAIMGPSGAGKSTVLHALAGRIKESNKLSFLQGHRFINFQPIAGNSMLPVAFIEQEVNFFPHMTVQETLDFRVQLKLGSLLSTHARNEMVHDLMEQVGLLTSADTIVGNANVRGLSGGERKRLSIAVEMISSPAAIFLDEPTSGLDSTAATSLIQTLRRLANEQGKTIVAVIHQPSQHVFAQFDDLLLISEGKQMYFGELDKVRSYMEQQLGYKALDEMGTAEHVLDCISRRPIGNETQEQADERMQILADAAAATTNKKGSSSSSSNHDPRLLLGEHEFESFGKQRLAVVSHTGPRAGIWTQFQLLLKRSMRELARGKSTLLIKLAQQVALAVIYGGIYTLGNTQAGIQDRFGLLSLITIATANFGIVGTIRSFPKEKAIVSGEIATNMYRTLPYFIGKALSELPPISFFNALFGVLVCHFTGLSKQGGGGGPTTGNSNSNNNNKLLRFVTLLTTHGFASQAIGLLLGAVSPSEDVAIALFPAFLVLNLIFDGRNISEENTPWCLRWIRKVSLIRWGYEGMCLCEFDGLTFDSSSGGKQRRGPVVKDGTEALARLGMGERTISDVFRAQLLITSISWALSWLGLTLTRQRFMVMEAPEDIIIESSSATSDNDNDKKDQ